MTIHETEQARLLDAYCDALTQDMTARPPDGLDPDLAATAQQLAGATIPEPDGQMLAALRGQLLGTEADTPVRAPHRVRRWPARTPLFAATTKPSTPANIQSPRHPSAFARLAGAALVAVVLAALIVSLAVLRPPIGNGGLGGAATQTPALAAAGPPVECGPAPVPTPAITPTPRLSGVPMTATAAMQLTTTAASRPSPTAAPPAPRADPCTMPQAGLLTLDQAAEKVRALLGEPQATLYAVYSSSGTPRNPTIWVTRNNVGRIAPIGGDQFQIDAVTGQLESAHIGINEPPNAPDAPIDEGEAAARAEVFARTQDPALDRLERRGAVPIGGTFARVDVTWQLRAAPDSAWLPTYITVGVSTLTGKVTYFSRITLDYRGPATPQVDAATAGELVLQTARQNPRYAQAIVSTTTLWVAAPKMVNNENTDFRLVWTIELANVNVPQGVSSEYLPTSWYVDALSGEVIPVKPRG